LHNKTWRRIKVDKGKRPARADDALLLGLLALAAFAVGAFLTYALVGLLL
jgi:hypothetical protein